MISTFARSVRGTLVRECGVVPGSTLVVGASGGADSTALAAALTELRESLSLRIVLAHLDHALRADSAQDARLVRDLAARLGAGFREERLPWDDAATRPHGNIEAASRNARYTFLRHVAAEFGGLVAVAHHADDVLETALAQMIQGAGPRGLSHPRARREDGVVRPLLDVTRAEILDYLEERGLPFSTDSTNLDGSNLRGRLRRDVVPLLLRENPAIARAAVRTARLFADHADATQAAACALLADTAIRECEEEIVLDAPRGRPYHRLILSTALREAAERLGGGPSRDGIAIFSEMADVWRTGARGSFDLSRGLRVVIGSDRIRLALRPTQRPTQVDLEFPIPGSVAWTPRVELRGEIGAPPADPASASNPQVAWLDAERIVWPLGVRRRAPGDRYRPLGLGGSAKVHDLLIDRKIPRERRDELPIVVDREGIVWIPGLRVDERARITGRTTRALRVEAASGVPARTGAHATDPNPVPRE